MKYVILLLILLLQANSFSQEAKVTFTVKTEKLKKNEKIFIAGNSELLGNWNPDKVELKKQKNNLWTLTASFPLNTRLEFKFTKGSWQNEALNGQGGAQGNLTFTVTKDTVLNFAISKWKGDGNIPVKITGTAKFHKNFKGTGLLPRDVIVWLPSGYLKQKDKRYPVLYMHDAQNIFDPNTSSMGAEWRMDEVTDSLIKSGKMNEIIIVGTTSTNDRSDEYAYGDAGKKYANFLIRELKPFIDKNYRTLNGPENTGVMGSSMGGLISLVLAWEHPEVFGYAGCLSPAFKVMDLDYTLQVQKEEKKRIKIYVDNGGVDLEARLQPGIEDMIKILKNKGYEEGKDLMIYFDKTAPHNERAWAQRVYMPLQFFFGTPAQN